MNTTLKSSILAAVLACLVVGASIFGGGIWCGRATAPTEIVYNETNIIYQFQVQSQVQAQNQLTIIESTNVQTIVFDYDFSNVLWELTNSDTNRLTEFEDLKD